MAKTTDPKVVIIVDDELHNMTWMVDYLESEELVVEVSSNANEALEAINGRVCRALIVDLNIPVLPPLEDAVSGKGPVYAQYPGLYIAQAARNIGYRDRQVIIYSVHKDPTVAEEARRLGCTYILKGRPREIKQELLAVLAFDPTA
ncbi:MAG: response regulator [Rhodospirillales bacterium]|nr:response regulator [Rhodospirillales bacterium]